MSRSPNQKIGSEVFHQNRYSGATPEATARWYRERLKNLRIYEVRGRVELNVPSNAQREGQEPEAEQKKEFGLPREIRLKDGTVIDTEKGTAPDNGEFVCTKDGRRQDVIVALRRAEHIAPLAVYLLQCHCPKRDAAGYNYGGRYFKVPDESDIARLVAAEREWAERSRSDLDPFWPKQELPFARRTHQKDVIPAHGYTHWAKLFDSRQLLIHTQLLKTIMTMQERGMPLDLCEQALGAFQQYLRNQNRFCFWNIGADKLEPMFSNSNYNVRPQTIGNGAFAHLGRGNWHSAVATVIEGQEYLKKPWETYIASPGQKVSGNSLEVGDEVSTENTQISCGSSMELGFLQADSFDLVITDPPFGDNLFYADLADFFYVWLRIPFLKFYEGRKEADYFKPQFTTKSVEVIENEAEHPDDRNDEQKKERIEGLPNPNYRPPPAEDFYEKGLTLCWAESFRVLKPGGILAFTFHHDEDRAWANVLRSLFEAGFLLVATYPVIADETKGDNAQFGSQKIAYDVIHVCRKRLERPEPVSWAKMRRWVRDEAARLKTLLEHSHGTSLSDADLRVILRGKALEFYSRHYGQVWIGQEILGVKEALLGINQLLDDLLAEGVAATQRPPEAADPITRLFLRLFARRVSMPRDELHKNLKGTTVDTALLADRGWVRVVGTTVHAVPVAERFQFFTAPGRNRKIIRTDLDQAQFLAGAALPRSGLSIEAELDRETFNVKPSVDPLLDWIAQTDASADVRQAAVLAKNIVANWRAKHAAERARRPESAQLELLIAQTEA